MSSSSTTPTQRSYAAAATDASTTANPRARSATTASSSMKIDKDKTPTPAVRPAIAENKAPPPWFPQMEGIFGQGFTEPATTASGVYRPPHAREDVDQSAAKVSRPFAQQAVNHNNSRWNKMPVPVIDTAAARMSSAAALYLQDPPAPVIPPVLPISSSTSSRRSSESQSPSAIGEERASGSLPLTDVPQRKVLAATLSLVRAHVIQRAQQEPEVRAVLEFLDYVFPRGGQAGTTYDAVIGTIEVAYWYPVNDADWLVWEDILAHCSLAKEVDETLSVGAAEFDQVNSTFPYNAHLVDSGDAPEKLLSQLVAHYNLNKKYDILFNWSGDANDKNREP